MATLSQVANVLPGWGYYLSGNQFGAENVNNQYGQDFLRQLQQYDPSAHFQAQQTYGGEGGDSGTTYTLQYDPSKLPNGGAPGMVDMNQGAYAGLRNDPNASYGGHLFDSNAVSKDPNGYGTVTSPRNMNVAADEAPDAIARYAPMIVMALATMGAGAPLLSALGGGGGAMTGANMGVAGINAVRALANGGGVQSLIPAAISMGGSALGVPSYATSLLNTGIGLAQGKTPNPIGAGMTLANIMRQQPGG